MTYLPVVLFADPCVELDIIFVAESQAYGGARWQATMPWRRKWCSHAREMPRTSVLCDFATMGHDAAEDVARLAAVLRICSNLLSDLHSSPTSFANRLGLSI